MESAPRARSRNNVSRFLYGVCGFAFLFLRISFFAGVLGLVFLLALPKIEALAEVDRIQVLYGVAVAFLVSVCSGFFLLVNRRKVTCPLCRVSLFSGHKSLVKRGAKRVFGSPKTAIALSTMKGAKSLDCPYCRERVRLQREA